MVSVNPHPLVSVYLTALVAESLLVGLLALLSVITVYLVAHRPKSAVAPSKYLLSFPFVGAATLVFLASLHWGISLYRAFSAFIGLGNIEAQHSFYVDIAQPTSVVKEAIYLLALSLADVLVVHRLWIIWGRRWAVASPALLATIATTGLATVIITKVAHCDPGCTDCCRKQLITWGIPWYFISVIMNFYSTGSGIPELSLLWGIYLPAGLIIYRDRHSLYVNTTPAMHALIGKFKQKFLSIIVESAAIQTTWLTLNSIVVASRSDGEFFFMDTFPAMVAVSAMLVHARVGLNWARESMNAALVIKEAV
ncbi:Aminotran-5 domain-containing protein [Mycena kentingensis (nom. inval.)]|nr:Aminotran-5 domain-containing protein [Mycena kentingensis (nom. inval.)]